MPFTLASAQSNRTPRNENQQIQTQRPMEKTFSAPNTTRDLARSLRINIARQVTDLIPPERLLLYFGYHAAVKTPSILNGQFF